VSTLVPSRTRGMVAFAVPAAEMICAVTLLAWPAFGIQTAIVLLGGLAVAALFLGRRYPDTPCGCFGGISSERLGLAAVRRNVALLGPLLYLALQSPVEPDPRSFAVVPLGAAATLLAVGGTEMMRAKRQDVQNTTPTHGSFANDG
jgi:Methylamine utilisation protein MauE